MSVKVFGLDLDGGLRRVMVLIDGVAFDFLTFLVVNAFFFFDSLLLSVSQLLYLFLAYFVFELSELLVYLGSTVDLSGVSVFIKDLLVLLVSIHQ